MGRRARRWNAARGTPTEEIGRQKNDERHWVEEEVLDRMK
jgi:hypothetical protein